MSPRSSWSEAVFALRARSPGASAAPAMARSAMDRMTGASVASSRRSKASRSTIAAMSPRARSCSAASRCRAASRPASWSCSVDAPGPPGAVAARPEAVAIAVVRGVGQARVVARHARRRRPGGRDRDRRPPRHPRAAPSGRVPWPRCPSTTAAPPARPCSGALRRTVARCPRRRAAGPGSRAAGHRGSGPAARPASAAMSMRHRLIATGARCASAASARTLQVAAPPAGLGEVDERLPVERSGPGHLLQLGASERQQSTPQVEPGQTRIRGPRSRGRRSAGRTGMPRGRAHRLGAVGSRSTRHALGRASAARAPAGARAAPPASAVLSAVQRRHVSDVRLGLGVRAPGPA